MLLTFSTTAFSSVGSYSSSTTFAGMSILERRRDWSTLSLLETLLLVLDLLVLDLLVVDLTAEIASVSFTSYKSGEILSSSVTLSSPEEVIFKLKLYVSVKKGFPCNEISVWIMYSPTSFSVSFDVSIFILNPFDPKLFKKTHPQFILPVPVTTSLNFSSPSTKIYGEM